MFAALAARPIVNRVICSLRRRLSRLYYSTESSCPTACDAVLMRQLNSGGVRIANLDKIKCTFLAARSEGQRSRPGRPSPVSHQLDGTRHLLTLSRRVRLRTIGAAQAGQWRKRGALQADQASCWVLPLPRKEPRSEEHTSELQSLMRISYA